MTEIPEAAVRAAAEKLREHYDSEFDASHLAWQDFASEAREVLAAALPHLILPATARYTELRYGRSGPPTVEPRYEPGGPVGHG